MTDHAALIETIGKIELRRNEAIKTKGKSNTYDDNHWYQQGRQAAFNESLALLRAIKEDGNG